MSARQYLPVYLEAHGKKLIVYPAKDEVPLSDITDREDLIRKLEALYASDESLATGEYHIIFAWNKDGALMFDVWIHTLNEHSDSGPLLEFHGYQNCQPVQMDDVASGDSVIVLGREEESRRNFISTSEYIKAKKLPDFAEDMVPAEEFS